MTSEKYRIRIIELGGLISKGTSTEAMHRF